MLVLNKQIGHSVEWYYGLDTPKEYYTQYLVTSNEFLRDKVSNCLSINELPSFYNELEDEYGISNGSDDFGYLVQSGFYEFFNSNNVDVPRFFKKTKSVKRGINNINLIKFNNYFMRSGKRYKALRLLMGTMWSIFEDIKSAPTLNNTSLAS